MSNGVGALTVTVLGTGTTALMLESAWVRGWLYHGQHLTASAVYGRELYASGGVAFYAAICVVFPIIGAIMGAFGSGLARMTGPLTDGGRPPGPPGPEPVPLAQRRTAGRGGSRLGQAARPPRHRGPRGPHPRHNPAENDPPRSMGHA